MEVKEIVKALEVFGQGHPFPREAVEDAPHHQEELTPILLDALDREYEQIRAEDYDESLDESLSDLCLYGMFLLAQFRETRAFPKLTRLLFLDESRLNLLVGEALVEGMGDILYSTYDGDLATLKAVVAGPDVYAFAKCPALRAMAGLLRDGRFPRDDAVRFLREVLSSLGDWEDAEDTGAFLAAFIADYGLYELVEDVREIYRQEKVDLFHLGDFSSFFDCLYKGKNYSDFPHIIQDSVKELIHWACFQPDQEKEDVDENKQDDKPSIQEILSWNVGRNDPCPCGSGKKFKKCCLPLQEDIKDLFGKSVTRQVEDEYPPVEQTGGRPGLRDFYPPEAIAVDRLAYQGMRRLYTSTHVRRGEREDRKEARKYLLRAFEKFQEICAREGLETLEDYDRRYKLHYLCEEWLWELCCMLDPAGKDHRAVLEALNKKEAAAG